MTQETRDSPERTPTRARSTPAARVIARAPMSHARARASAARRRRGASAAAFYAATSVATVFLNKAIFSVWAFRLPATLVTAQTAFTACAIVCLETFGVIRRSEGGETGRRRGRLDGRAFRRVGLVSAAFQAKLVLDMKALSMINIPMYGVLKSSTTPFVMLIDYAMLGKVASARVQAAVWVTTLGGVLAGTGDLEFTFWGYLVALSSALCTAMYVVLVGKIGNELNVDSFTLLLYNSMWSAPLSLALMLACGEHRALAKYPHLTEIGFVLAFVCSCSSAFVLNYATYVCTQLNDALTTSVVGRTKSIFQGLVGLVVFHVHTGLLNILGIGLNSVGVAWYAYERYMGGKLKEAPMPADRLEKSLAIHREDSQLELGIETSLSPRSASKAAYNKTYASNGGRMHLPHR